MKRFGYLEECLVLLKGQENIGFSMPGTDKTEMNSAEIRGSGTSQVIMLTATGAYSM